VVLLTCLTGICISVPFLPPGQIWIFLLVVFLTGCFSSGCYGTLFQLVTLYPKLATSFLSLGYASPGVLLLLLSMAVFGSSRTSDDTSKFTMYFGICASIVVVGFFSYLLLLWTSNDILGTSSSYLKIAETAEDILEDDNGSQNKSLDKLEKHPLLPASRDIQEDAALSGTPNNWVLFKNTWRSCLSIFLLMISRVAVVTILTYVPSQSGESAKGFTQKLVFINLGCDLGGRFLTLILPSLPERRATVIVLVGALVQFMTVSVALLYIFGNGLIPPVDVASEVGVALFAICTGYFQTGAYAYAPRQTPNEWRPQVAALMNISTQVGNYIGLGLSFTLQLTLAR